MVSLGCSSSFWLRQPIKRWWNQWDKGAIKGHFFSDHSTLTNRPDTKTQLTLFFVEDLCFSSLKVIYSHINEQFSGEKSKKAGRNPRRNK